MKRRAIRALRPWRVLCCALAAIGIAPKVCAAHGLLGKRFFPTTVTIEDPFVSDELSLVVDRGTEERNDVQEGAQRTTAGAIEFSKKVTDRFGFSLGEEFRNIKLEADGSRSGFGNFEFGFKRQYWESEEHEAVLSVGLRSEIGGTGAARIEAKSYSVLTPTVYFAKGLGDLPDSLQALKPFAVTGVVGTNLPLRRSSAVVDEVTGDSGREKNPVTLTWGVALQYSLQYLDSSIEGVDLGRPFDRMTLVVEFPMETELGSGNGGKTIGMVAPGVVWVGDRFELGIAVQIPINDDSGSGVGVVALVHFFLDDLFPDTPGKPLAR